MINGYAEHPYGLPGIECSDIENRKLQEEVMNVSKSKNINVSRLIPEDAFQPIFLEIPTPPKA